LYTSATATAVAARAAVHLGALEQPEHELHQQLQGLKAKFTPLQQHNSRMQQQLSQKQCAHQSLFSRQMQLQQHLAAAEQQLSTGRRQASKLSQQVHQGLQVPHTQFGPNCLPAFRFKAMLRGDRNRGRYDAQCSSHQTPAQIQAAHTADQESGMQCACLSK
jgi:hypothetical protein